MPVTPEQEWDYWDTKATELRRTQLGTVQASATKWSALMGALLGVFGTVAFAGGLTTLDKLDAPWAGLAKTVTLAAVAFAIAAIVSFGSAAGGLRLRRRATLNGPILRDSQTTQIGRALGWLRAGRLCSVSAAILVIAGSTVVLWIGEKEAADKKPPTVIAVVDGQAVCGKLKGAGGAELRVGSVELANVTDLTVVDACP